MSLRRVLGEPELINGIRFHAQDFCNATGNTELGTVHPPLKFVHGRRRDTRLGRQLSLTHPPLGTAVCQSHVTECTCFAHFD